MSDHADTVTVPLSQGLVATIDAADLEQVGKYKWHAVRVRKQHSTHYARAKIGGRHQYLHRFLTDAKRGETIDHENRNGLDCRRRNLRRATRSQNGGNSRRKTNSRTPYRGVSFHARAGKWLARCRRTYLGLHETPVAAAEAYNRAAREKFGEFAALNDLPTRAA